MSNLKHLSLDELEKQDASTIAYINKMRLEIYDIEKTIKPFTDKIQSLRSKINGQYTRLEWIQKYKQDKTHITMTHAQVEGMLGQKIIIID